MAAKKYYYETCCIHSTAALINALKASAKKITYETFRRNAEGLKEWAESMAYDWTPRRGGLTLKNDWHVQYFRGTYDGHRCYFLVHSRIEYIWTQGA